MDPFVRRLVQRLLDPARPLSRNRHFLTFATDEGRMALRVSRRLRSLQRDVQASHAQGNVPRVARQVDERGGWRLEITLPWLQGTRSTWLGDAEYELLCALPGMELLHAAAASVGGTSC